LFILAQALQPPVAQIKKVFCFFFTKKKSSLPLRQATGVEAAALSAANNVPPFITPNPVQASHPGPALYPSVEPAGILLPWVISRNAASCA
jgi:hypothetical protein